MIIHLRASSRSCWCSTNVCTICAVRLLMPNVHFAFTIVIVMCVGHCTRAIAAYCNTPSGEGLVNINITREKKDIFFITQIVFWSRFSNIRQACFWKTISQNNFFMNTYTCGIFFQPVMKRNLDKHLVCVISKPPKLFITLCKATGACSKVSGLFHRRFQSTPKGFFLVGLMCFYLPCWFFLSSM